LDFYIARPYRAVAELIVHSPAPIVLLWGEDGYMIYNDAYSYFAGRRRS